MSLGICIKAERGCDPRPWRWPNSGPNYADVELFPPGTVAAPTE